MIPTDAYTLWWLAPVLPLVPFFMFGSPDPPDPPPPPVPPEDENAAAEKAGAEQKAQAMGRRGRSSTILAGRGGQGTLGAARTPAGGGVTPSGGGVTGPMAQTESAPMAMDGRRKPLY